MNLYEILIFLDGMSLPAIRQFLYDTVDIRLHRDILACFDSNGKLIKNTLA